MSAGRFLDHVHIRSSNVEASRRFYRAGIEALGLARLIDKGPKHFLAGELWTQRCNEHQAQRNWRSLHYRVQKQLVAALLLASVTHAATAGYETPDAAVDALWNALSHAAGEAPDAAALEEVFNERAVVFGSRPGPSGPVLSRDEKAVFIERLKAPRFYRFAECEVDRSVTVEGPFAVVESRVISTRSEERQPSTFVGINSVQLYEGESGWTIVSLYYHVLPEMSVSDREAGSRCQPSAVAHPTR